MTEHPSFASDALDKKAGDLEDLAVRASSPGRAAVYRRMAAVSRSDANALKQAQTPDPPPPPTDAGP